MSALTSTFPQRVGQRALGVAVVGIIISIVLGWMHRDVFAAAYRFAGIACLEPAVGSLIFLLIYKTTGGDWAKPLVPFLSAGVRLLPWCWLALLPLLWIDPNPQRALPPNQPALSAYLSHEGLAIRALVYTIIFFAFRWALHPFLTRLVVIPDSPAPSGADREDLSDQEVGVINAHLAPRIRPWVGPLGLIVLVFSMHLLATDWLLATEPDWSSTGFPLVWLCGQAVAGLSLALTAALSMGIDPSRRLRNGSALGVDWGNLLLATIVFWIYVAFVQLLIIWSGNLPRETVWYLHRWHGAWRSLLVGVVCLHFVIPFFLLLSKNIKRRPGTLRAVTTLVASAQVVYVSWMILPSYHLSGLSEYGLVLALLVAGSGLFLNRYLANISVDSVVAPIIG